MGLRIAAVVLVILTARVAAGGTLSFACDVLSGPSGPSGGANCQGNSVGGIASVNDTYGFTQLTASDEAITNYGEFGVASSTSFDISGTAQRAYSFAIGDFGDDITISSPLLNGSTGLLSVDYTLDGTITTSGAGSAVVQVAINLLNSGASVSQDSITAYTSSVSGTFRAPTAFTFTFGQPFSFYMCLGAATGQGIIPAVLPTSGHVSTFDCAPGFSGASTGSGSGSAAFFNTLVLSGLTVTDGLGNLVNGEQFTSASGTQYGPDGVVPEPGTSTLAIVGLTLLVSVLFRRRYNDHNKENAQQCSLPISTARRRNL